MSLMKCETHPDDGYPVIQQATQTDINQWLADRGMVAVNKEALEFLEDNSNSYEYMLYLEMINAAQEPPC